MGKGPGGSGGLRGVGGAGGRGAGGLGVLSAPIPNAGAPARAPFEGRVGLLPEKQPTRDELNAARQPYEGLFPEEATTIANGQAPVVITFNPSGSPQVSSTGAARLWAAREAGASSLRARLIVLNPDGSIRWQGDRSVPIWDETKRRGVYVTPPADGVPIWDESKK